MFIVLSEKNMADAVEFAVG